VGRIVDLGQVLEVEVGVDLGGGDIGVAQELADGAEIAHLALKDRGRPRSSHDLRDPQSRGVDEFQEGAVAVFMTMTGRKPSRSLIASSS